MADKQTPNPFEDFQPSWLKKAQAKSIESAPVVQPPTKPLSDDDILFQELIAPLRTTNTAPVTNPSAYNNPTSYPAYNSPESYNSNPTPYDNVVSYNTDPTLYSSPNGVPAYFAQQSALVEPLVSGPELAAPVLASSEKAPAKKTTPKSKTTRSPRGKGWWTRELLILGMVLTIIVIVYVAFVELQGTQRTANSLPAKTIGSLTTFPNAYGTTLTSDEYKNFEIGAVNLLDNIDKFQCYRTSSSPLVVQDFYQGQLGKQNYNSVEIGNQNSIQNWAWSNAAQSGVILSADSIGWFDMGFFNRAAPGETIFCVFTGKMSSQAVTASAPSASNSNNPPAPAPASNNNGDNGGGGSSNNNGDNSAVSPVPIKQGPTAAPQPQPGSTTQPSAQQTPSGKPSPTVPPTPTKPPIPTPTPNPLDKGA